MSEEVQALVLHLLAAISAGGIIGMERSHHARPAGFRTHALVCLGACVLMMVATGQAQALSDNNGSSRVAQGIMTGIGFLGAGVIFKEGLSVRGLTTAAAIWVTSALGILIGSSFYLLAALTTALTLIVLTLFRWIEAKIPVLAYAELNLGFARDHVMPEDALREMLHTHGFDVSNFSYRTNADGTQFEYHLVIRTAHTNAMAHLSSSLHRMPEVQTFEIAPSSNDNGS